MTRPSARKRYAFRDYLNRRVLTMLALGFSSGLPFALVGITFSYWLRDGGVSLTTIGVLSAVNTVYALKFLWSPVMDRVNAPLLKALGRRRGWMFFAQIFVAAGLVAMALEGPGHLAAFTAAALCAAFASASQDIVIDAWRIESAVNSDELGLLTSANSLGYRIAVILTDSWILIMAQHLGWSFAYFFFAALMVVGMIAVFFASESHRADAAMALKEREAPLWSPGGFFDAVTGPFVEFFRTHGAAAILMLLAISLFQAPNFAMGPMANPLYHDIGLSKDMVGFARGIPGLIGTFLGVAAGGYLSLRLGFLRALLFGGTSLIIGTMLYAVLPYSHGLFLFSAIMAADNFSIAIAGITLVAYMSSLTSLGYTATQYALLTSAYAWVGKGFKIGSGAVVDGLTPHFGHMNAYALFFVGCGFLGVPSVALFALLERRRPVPA